MVIFICCFSKQATLRNCETQTVQCTQTQENLFAFYLNQILTILFEFSLTISLFYCKRRKYLRNFQKLVLPGQYVNHHNRKVGKMLFSNFYKTEKQSHKFYQKGIIHLAYRPVLPYLILAEMPDVARHFLAYVSPRVAMGLL